MIQQEEAQKFKLPSLQGQNNSIYSSSDVSYQMFAPSVARRPLTWYDRHLRSSISAFKIQKFHEVLRVQRKRHILNREMEENEIKYKMKDSHVDIDTLREFLQDPYSTEHVKNLIYEDTPEFLELWKK